MLGGSENIRRREEAALVAEVVDETAKEVEALVESDAPTRRFRAIRSREDWELAKLEREKYEAAHGTQDEIRAAIRREVVEGSILPMGKTTGSLTPISPTATTTNVTRTSKPYKTRRERNAERPAKKSGKTPKLEDIYRDPIKHGLCKIVRERGKPPRIVWL